MKQNPDGTLEKENESRPGSIGDSMAETSREIHLIDLTYMADTQEAKDQTTILMNFRTSTGYVRHPDAPLVDEKGNSWRETDSPTDQCMPWYLSIPDIYAKAEMKSRIVANYWRTGNNNFVSPVFWAILTGNTLLLSVFCYLQILIFDAPFRWSDAFKKFEPSQDASADYLNWFHAAIYAYPWARVHMPKDHFMNKVKGYYADEPNSQWIINLYQTVADKYLK